MQFKRYVITQNIKKFSIYLFFSLTQLILILIVMSFLANIIIVSKLDKKIIKIEQDLIYEKGEWNIDQYNNDKELIGLYPLYIILNDGFVLDRRDPIPGFLDTTDFRRLLSYSNPVTIKTVAHQTRRVIARPIGSNNNFEGVIVVSYYNPQFEIIDKIDSKLIKNLNYISSTIVKKGNNLDLSSLDPRIIDFDIAYSVIDKFNTVIERSDNVNNIRRNPSYVDPSYVNLALKSKEHTIYINKNNKNNYLVEVKPLIKNGKTLGVIAVGESLLLLDLLKSIVLILSVPLALTTSMFSLFFINKIKEDKDNKLYINDPKYINFDAKLSKLLINDTQIEIPYATNQYYFLKTIFSFPNKRWETDELLNKFGESAESVNWRKVYDTMIGINKKTEVYLPDKLVINKNKTYQLNPRFVFIVESTSF